MKFYQKISDTIILLLIQSPCAICFKRLKLTMAELGVRKGLLTEEVKTKKVGGLSLKSVLRKSGVQASFISTKGKMGGAVFVRTQAPNRILLMVSMCKAGAVSLKVEGTTQA